MVGVQAEGGFVGRLPSRTWAPLAIVCVTLVAYAHTLSYPPHDGDLLARNTAERVLLEKGWHRFPTSWFSYEIGRRPANHVRHVQVDQQGSGYDSRRFRPAEMLFDYALSQLHPTNYLLWRSICLFLVLLGNLAVFWMVKIWTRSEYLALLGAVLYSLSFPRYQSFEAMGSAGGVFVGFSSVALGCYLLAREASETRKGRFLFASAGIMVFLALLFHDAAIHIVPIVLAIELRRSIWKRTWKLEYLGVLSLFAAVLVYLALRAVDRPGGGEEVFRWPTGIYAWAKSTGFLAVRLLYELYHSRAFDLVEEAKASLRGNVSAEFLFLTGLGGIGALSLFRVVRKGLAAGNAYAGIAVEAMLVALGGLLLEVLDPHITSGRSYALSTLGISVTWAALIFLLLGHGARGLHPFLRTVAAVFVLAHVAYGLTTTVRVVRVFSRDQEALSEVVTGTLKVLEESGLGGPRDLTLHYLNVCDFPPHCGWPTYSVGTFEEILRDKAQNPNLGVFLHQVVTAPSRDAAPSAAFGGAPSTAGHPGEAAGYTHPHVQLDEGGRATYTFADHRFRLSTQGHVGNAPVQNLMFIPNPYYAVEALEWFDAEQTHPQLLRLRFILPPAPHELLILSYEGGGRLNYRHFGEGRVRE